MNNAIVVTTSKYKSDFQPILPTCLKSEWPAIPTTKVEKRIGAIIVFTKRKNIWLRTFKSFAKAGKSKPISTPISMLTKIHVVSDRFKMANHIIDPINIHRKILKNNGEILLKL